MREAPRTTADNPRGIFVWELPLRLFHWSLPVLLLVLYGTIKLMDDGIEAHALAGYVLITLLLFRLVWGFAGGTYSRFRDFLYGPKALLRYVRTLPSNRPEPIAGHTPLGGVMVMVLLAGLLTQAVLGLFGNDDILFDGPLRRLVSKETSDTLTAWHAVRFNVLLGLVALHITAVLYHWFHKGENLVGAMITGYKQLPAKAGLKPTQGGKVWLAAIVLAGSALLVWFIVR
jgi:cytochrome b